ncbi:Asp-tRNA(Asn)/Glu-tRNA(Gln) amidotransferase subunit GatC [Halococcus sp. AFM35]|uniref:Asp-tRNA(Asn)/Glu-tRNA(Gln) amidotransferase subunit GatC n=1 Tax=Halococcus sp. AFM35 TaxID=3421653 RepID=UPI003EB95E8A
MTDRSVDPQAVAHVAALARVDLDESEVDEFAAQFADVLGYFETLDEVPDVESDPDLVNVLRTDEARESLSQDEALKNAPETDEGYFEGPPVG